MALPPLVDPVRALYRLRRDKDEQYPATGKNPSKAPKDERPRESQAEHPEEPLFSFPPPDARVEVLLLRLGLRPALCVLLT